jgi:hypothetical protein
VGMRWMHCGRSTGGVRVGGVVQISILCSYVDLDWIGPWPVQRPATKRSAAPTAPHARAHAGTRRLSAYPRRRHDRHDTPRTAPEQWFCTGCALTDGLLRACPAHIGHVKGRWKARSGQVRPRRVRYLPTYRARRLAYSTVGNGRQALVLNTPPSPRRTCTCSASITSSMATATTHQTHLADQTRPHQTRPDPSPPARCA